MNPTSSEKATAAAIFKYLDQKAIGRDKQQRPLPNPFGDFLSFTAHSACPKPCLRNGSG